MRLIGCPKSKLVSGNNLKYLKDDSEILVNSNRLYWQLSELSRTPQKKAVIQIILDKLDRLNDDQKVYVQMSVRDVKKCFGENLAKVPINTFRHVGAIDVTRRKRKDLTL